MSTIASIASQIGVARKPTQGSWRAGGHHLHRIAGDVDGLARNLDAGGGLERHVHEDVLSRGNAAEDAAGVVAQKARRA